MQLGPKVEDENVKEPVNPLLFLSRFVLGTIAATYYVLVSVYMWMKYKIVPKVISHLGLESEDWVGYDGQIFDLYITKITMMLTRDSFLHLPVWLHMIF